MKYLFVLTQPEVSKIVPVAVVSSERKALEWHRKEAGNDFFPLELDRVEHLGIGPNGPAFDPQPPFQIKIPTPPALTIDTDPREACRIMAVYLESLCDSIEEFNKRMQT